MVYLTIMVLVAAVGIGSLWVQQRRQRAHLETVEGFRSKLEKISPHSTPGPFRQASVTRRPARRRVPGRPVPLDPARREEARRRVEARRRAALARVNARSAGYARRAG